jgi:mRNA-degrading endonuclease RelE of RelBE toxin-antitoxin system
VKVTYTNVAIKQMRRLPAADRIALNGKLVAFAETRKGDVKKLVNRPEYRLRHGQWRAFFEIEGEIIVVKIAHRREAYK